MMMMAGSRKPDGHLLLMWTAVWLLCLAAFVALGVRASTGEVLAADLRIARWVQSGPPFFGWLTGVANGVNLAPVLAILVFLPVAWLARRAYVFESASIAGTLAV